MNDRIMTFDEIVLIVKPLAEKYKIDSVYLFGSYAREEADGDSDLDFLVYGGDEFRSVSIFAFAEEIRNITKKNVDAFEIREINQDSDFYKEISKERKLVA
ncbi:MAG: nucleotidyltransferase domain-containing protein [Lachnospiraceae bacterium]|jgi:predicted nucleotidyltransferase|nr:nucleotidyltransferase domain-containing protein [Lachnospiraceae bacterium]